MADASWEDLAAAFLATLIGKSPRTAATYRSGLRRLGEFLTERDSPSGPSGDRITSATLEEFERDGPSGPRVDRITPATLEEFYAWLIRTYGRDPGLTVATYLSGARAFLRFLDRRELLPAGVTFERLQAHLREVVGKKQYRTPRVDRRLPKIVVVAEDRPLPPTTPQNAAKRLEILRDRALLHTLYTTGLRRAEVASLNRDDVEDGWADRALITGKGGKERVVFFEEAALAAIRLYVTERADRYAPLFIRHDRGRGQPGPGGSRYRLSAHSIWSIVRAYADLAGARASPHDFRHTKATVLLNRGAKLSEVQDILGHASPETTKRIYAHYEVAHLKEAFDRYSVPARDLARAARRSPGNQSEEHS